MICYLNEVCSNKHLLSCIAMRMRSRQVCDYSMLSAHEISVVPYLNKSINKIIYAINLTLTFN